MSNAVDFLIVGAGSAGCVLANRLSKHGQVMLLEAGPADHRWDFRLHMPAALSMVLSSSWYNWHYSSEPEPFLDNRRLYCPRGRVLGGSSAINGMIFVRGHRADFDRWSSVYGLTDWDYQSCLPYFRRSETAGFSESPLRGRAGPLNISRGEAASPLFGAWFEACEQAGYPRTDDFNGEHQEGAGYFDRTISGGTRQNTSRAYLDPVRHSVDVRTGTRVSQIMFSGNRATGVQTSTGEVIKAGEIFLCGGAINSPQLLMLSGIGDEAALKTHNITPVTKLPGVGMNLQDHLEIYVQFACRQPVSVYPSTRWYRKPVVGLDWLLRRSGAGATNHFEAGAFLKSSADKSYPDLQYHFLPIAMDYDGKAAHRSHGFQLHVGPMKPTSRGSVSLRSADPATAPLIRFNYNSTAEDQAVMRSGIRMARQIVSQPAFDAYRGEGLRLAGDSDEEIDRFVRQHAESAYHPSGTCRMGADDNAVVDQQGKVHGVEGLRVADASIMPEITNGNLNAPVIMMAEKIADTVVSTPSNTG